MKDDLAGCVGESQLCVQTTTGGKSLVLSHPACGWILSGGSGEMYVRSQPRFAFSVRVEVYTGSQLHRQLRDRVQRRRCGRTVRCAFDPSRGSLIYTCCMSHSLGTQGWMSQYGAGPHAQVVGPCWRCVDVLNNGSVKHMVSFFELFQLFSSPQRDVCEDWRMILEHQID